MLKVKTEHGVIFIGFNYPVVSPLILAEPKWKAGNAASQCQLFVIVISPLLAHEYLLMQTQVHTDTHTLTHRAREQKRPAKALFCSHFLLSFDVHIKADLCTELPWLPRRLSIFLLSTPLPRLRHFHFYTSSSSQGDATFWSQNPILAWLKKPVFSLCWFPHLWFQSFNEACL